MPEIALDPPSLSCYRLFFEYGIKQFQCLGPDLFCFAARNTRALRQRSFGNARLAASQPGGGVALQPKEDLAAD